MSFASKTVLKEAGQEIPSTGFLHYRDFLGAIYDWLKTKVDHYAYLKFADDLGFSQTNILHLVITGKRPLSSKAAERVVAALSLTGVRRTYFLDLVAYNNAKDPIKREQCFQRLMTFKSRSLADDLQKAQLAYYSDWYHPVIREMASMPGFRGDPEWVASRVRPRIRPEQARRSLELLVTLDLLKHDKKRNSYTPTSINVTTGNEVASMAVIRFHHKMIELGRESITRVHQSERDIGAITVSVSPEVAVRMKTEVQRFRKQMMALAEESKAADRVLQLNIQLFPVTE